MYGVAVPKFFSFPSKFSKIYCSFYCSFLPFFPMFTVLLFLFQLIYPNFSGSYKFQFPDCIILLLLSPLAIPSNCLNTFLFSWLSDIECRQSHCLHHLLPIFWSTDIPDISGCLPHRCSPGTVERIWRQEELPKAWLCCSISAPRHPWLTSHLIFFLFFSGNRAAGKCCSMLGSGEHRAYGLVGTSRSCCCMQLFPFLLYSIAKGSVAGGEMRFPLYLLQISNKYFVPVVLLYQCQSQKKSLGEKDGGERKGS